jgi:hypothetical protein
VASIRSCCPTDAVRYSFCTRNFHRGGKAGGWSWMPAQSTSAIYQRDCSKRGRAWWDGARQHAVFNFYNAINNMLGLRPLARARALGRKAILRSENTYGHTLHGNRPPKPKTAVGSVPASGRLYTPSWRCPLGRYRLPGPRRPKARRGLCADQTAGGLVARKASYTCVRLT